MLEGGDERQPVAVFNDELSVDPARVSWDVLGQVIPGCVRVGADPVMALPVLQYEVDTPFHLSYHHINHPWQEYYSRKE
jgi:hypothetical protein